MFIRIFSLLLDMLENENIYNKRPFKIAWRFSSLRKSFAGNQMEALSILQWKSQSSCHPGCRCLSLEGKLWAKSFLDQSPFYRIGFGPEELELYSGWNEIPSLCCPSFHNGPNICGRSRVAHPSLPFLSKIVPLEVASRLIFYLGICRSHFLTIPWP